MIFNDDDAVTPVVGTVLVLLISMAGMGAILAWGVPTVQGIQDQSTLASMQGELSDVRLDTVQLTIVDTARTAFISLSAGELALEEGSRFAIGAMHNQSFPASPTAPKATCDIRVTGWDSTSDTLAISEEGNCGDIVIGTPLGNQLTFQLDALVGASIQSRSGINHSGTGPWTIQSDGDDFSEGEWRLRLIDADDQVHAQIFIIGTERLAWHLQTSVTELDLSLEAAALFQTQFPAVYNLVPLRVNEEIFITGDHILELPTYSGSRVTVGSPSDPQIFLQLQGSHPRVVGQDTLRLRYSISGDLAEAWCNTLVFRSIDITAGTYTEDAAATCETGDPTGIRSVVYEPTADSFPFEFIQKRVYVAITS
jgi:hypothetical protein